MTNTLPQAAYLLFVAETGRLLAIPRLNSDIFMPGGKLKEGEAPLQAALREMHREIGTMIISSDGRLLHRGEYEVGEDGLFDCFTFLFMLRTEVLMKTGASWCTWDDLRQKYVFQKYISAVYEQYKKHMEERGN